MRGRFFNDASRRSMAPEDTIGYESSKAFTKKSSLHRTSSRGCHDGRLVKAAELVCVCELGDASGIVSLDNGCAHEPALVGLD